MKPGTLALAELCRRDPCEFVTQACWGLDYQAGEAKQRRFKALLWPGQQRALRLIQDERRTVILKARGIGITWGVLWYSLWLLWAQGPAQVLLMSKREEEAHDLLYRLNYARKGLPDWIDYPQPQRGGDNKGNLLLENESEIVALPASGDAIHSYHPRLVIADEWARVPDPIWHGVLGAIEDGDARFIGISTARGTGNEFARVWRDAVGGGREYKCKPLFLSWRDNPTRKERPSGRVEIIAEQYPETAEEAFQETGGLWFDQDALAVVLGLAKRPIRQERNGGVLVWVEAHPVGSYVIGVDVAEGVSGQDYCDATVLRHDTGEEVAALRGVWPPSMYASLIFDLSERYPGWIVVERNGLGLAVIEKLMELCPERLWRAADGKAGFWLSPQNRGSHWGTGTVLGDLEEGVRTRRVRFHAPAFFAEASVFGVQPNGKLKAPEGEHDDAVMSRALAWHVRKNSEPLYVGAALVGPRRSRYNLGGSRRHGRQRTASIC